MGDRVRAWLHDMGDNALCRVVRAIYAAAHPALVARQRARDNVDTAIPEWEPEVGETIVMALQNPFNGFDVTSPDQPHGYGPSLRALWAAGRRLDPSSPEPWRQIIAWARHRPAAWEVEDRRKTQGLVIQHQR